MRSQFGEAQPSRLLFQESYFRFKLRFQRRCGGNRRSLPETDKFDLRHGLLKGAIPLGTAPSGLSSAYGFRTFFAPKVWSPAVLNSKPPRTSFFPPGGRGTPQKAAHSLPQGNKDT